MDGIDVLLDHITNLYSRNIPRARVFSALLVNYIEYTADIWPNSKNVL